MASIVFNILLLIICQSYASCNKSVPVLLWESKSVSTDDNDLGVSTSVLMNGNDFEGVSALKLMGSDAFEDLLVEKMKDKNLLLLFVEEALDIEDFTWKFENEHSFPQLEGLESKANVTYLPLVFKPMSVLYNFPNDSQEWHEMSVKPEGLDDNIFHINEDDKYVLLHFRDDFGDKSRVDLLKIHGKFIKMIYGQQRKHRSILGIYTALQGFWGTGEEPKSRNTREAPTENFCCPYYGSSNESAILLYTATHPKLMYNDTVYVLNTTCTTNLTGNETHQTWDMTFNNDTTLRFHFHLSPSHTWNLRDILYLEGDDIPLKYNGPASIEAPLGFSYHCSSENNNRFTSNSTVLVFHGIQVEAFMKNETERRFGDTYDCATFMTIPILSGIFITCILGGILILALTMMLNIKTTDRFDDVRGRTVTINAVE